MNDITREQAAQIFDLDSYKEVTGAKRFKRTKEEMQLGLTPERALQRRLENLRGPQSERKDDAPDKDDRKQLKKKSPRRASTSRKGDIILHIRPAAGTDVDYFEKVPDGDIEVVLDQNWYGWYDTLAECPFDLDVNRLMTFILNEGIGEVLTKYHFPDDLPQE